MSVPLCLALWGFSTTHACKGMLERGRRVQGLAGLERSIRREGGRVRIGGERTLGEKKGSQ